VTGSARNVWPAGGVLVGGAFVFVGVLVASFAWTRDARWFELYTTRLSCVTDASATRGFDLERWGGIAAGALLVGAAWPVARAAARLRPRALGRAVGRCALASALALLACEVLLRVVHPVTTPASMTNLPRADSDGKLGWRYLPLHTKVTEFPGDGLTIEYDVDADGNRARSTTEVPDHAAPTILFAGESITAGIGVHWEDTYPALVAGELGVQGANLGVHGYGLDQVYLRTMEALEAFTRPVALVTLVLADELERSAAGDRKHLVLSRDGSLLLRDPAPWLWQTSTLRDLLLRATHYDDGDAIDLARAILRSTVAQARAHGARPLFVMTNFGPRCLPDASGEPALEHLLFDDLPAPHVRVDLDASWRLKDDPHPDSRASRKLADAIEQALRRE
jgi:hypothetical protein